MNSFINRWIDRFWCTLNSFIDVLLWERSIRCFPRLSEWPMVIEVHSRFSGTLPIVGLAIQPHFFVSTYQIAPSLSAKIHLDPILTSVLLIAYLISMFDCENFIFLLSCSSVNSLKHTWDDFSPVPWYFEECRNRLQHQRFSRGQLLMRSFILLFLWMELSGGFHRIGFTPKLAGW